MPPWSLARSLSLYAQINRFPELKNENPPLREVHSQVLQNVAVRIDLAFKAFFRRVKAGEKPGYPRFRGEEIRLVHLSAVGVQS